MIPPVHVGLGAAVLLDAATWAGWSFVVGLAGARLGEATVASDTRLTRARDFEADGRFYEQLSIRGWKDRLPEFGRFAGGRSKRVLPGSDRESLAIFAAETRRAEYVHWAIIAGLPIFTVWNPWPLLAAMAVYAFAANLPCIAIQRYNRLRIARIVDRAARHRGATT